jgi:SAM-dependent methyltransferase
MTRKKYRSANQKMWDRFVDINARSALYQLSEFRKGRNKLSALERAEVGDVRGKRLLHLQCHFGMDTLSWAILGARVTGVDFSEKGILLARQLSQELGIPASFLCSDVYDLPRRLAGTFDIVFTSYGVLCWLDDLPRWARLIRDYLKPGGFFYMAEFHPFAQVFENETPISRLEVRYSYFRKKVMQFKVDGSYASATEKIPAQFDYEWMHTLSEVVDALLGVGLRLEFLHEHPFTVFQAFPFLKKTRDGTWHLPRGMPSLPLTFSLKANKLA